MIDTDWNKVKLSKLTVEVAKIKFIVNYKYVEDDPMQIFFGSICLLDNPSINLMNVLDNSIIISIDAIIQERENNK